MSSPRRLLVAVGWLALLIVLGSLGYVVIEGYPPFDALYMTITTLSTVGYGEIHPLGTAGRAYTIVLILTGVGTVLYVFGVVAQLLIEGRLRAYFGRTTMKRTIERLDGHVIVCGYGRFGRVVAGEIRSRQLPMVIVDSDPALEPALQGLEVPFILGDALADDVLERAGIRRARALVVGTASDADNVFITLSAREKNAHIRIHARGESEAGIRRLRLAGADQVVSAYQTGGLRIAAAIARPSVIDFLEIGTPGRDRPLDVEEVRLAAGCAIVGRSVQSLEQEHSRLRVVALKHGDESITLIPDPSTGVAAGDYVIVIGERNALERLAQLAQAPST